MAFEGRYRDTQRGGGFGSGATSVQPSENGAAADLQELDKELVNLQGCVQSIGTQFDSKENRAVIKRLRSVIKSKVTATKTSLKKSPSPQNKILLDRQTAQLDSQITRFQDLLERERSVVKQHPAPPNAGSSDAGYREEVVSPAQSQSMSQVQRMGGLEEREQEAQELQQLETDIVDLREIHQEMAQLVGEQGEDITNIEKNVSKAAVRVESGTKQTGIAVRLKKSSTRLKLIIAAIITAAVLAVLIVLAILLGIFIPRATNN